jgi:hypothetical protein
VSTRKVSLAALADRAVPLPPPVAPIPEPVPEELVSTQHSVSIEQPAVESRPQRQPNTRASDRAALPAVGEWRRYDQYERKEARLREDQYNRLSEVSRRLNKARNGNGERITENTLIRVAIDLLLANDAQLLGTSEAEIRTSLGL